MSSEVRPSTRPERRFSRGILAHFLSNMEQICQTARGTLYHLDNSCADWGIRECDVIRTLHNRFSDRDCRPHLRCLLGAHANALDCSRWDCACRTGHPDGCESHSSKRFGALTMLQDGPPAFRSPRFKFELTQEILKNEIQLGMWRTARNHAYRFCCRTSVVVHPHRPAADALRTARCRPRSRLCLGRWLLGAQWTPLPLGCRTLGPCSL